MFITFEGGEGVGKTTLINNLTKFLETKQIDFVVSREPGGTKKSEEIREILLSNENLSWEQRMDLFIEARIDHNVEVIIPALEANKIVIVDRYFDSTFVYQGLNQSVDKFKTSVLKNLAHEQIKIPDITFVCNYDPLLARKRLSSNNREQNFIDKKPIEFHLKTQDSYLQLNDFKNKYFKEEFKNQKMITLDCSLELNQIIDQILKTINL